MLVRHKRRQHPLRQILTIAVLLLSSYLIAHTINAWVRDVVVIPPHSRAVSPVTRDQADSGSVNSSDRGRLLARDIISSGLFLISSSSSTKASLNDYSTQSKPVNVSGRWALIGVALGAASDHRAVLEERSTGKQSLYRVAQQIPGIGELIEIERNRVLIRAGLKEEWLDLAVVRPEAATVLPPPPEPIKKLPSPHRVMDRMQLVQAAEKPEYYVTEATFHPHINRNGNVEGFRLEAIRPVGVLDNAGLQEDDILSGINGVDTRDPVKLWEMFRQFPHEHVIHLNVMRQGEPVTLTVDVRG